MDKLVCVAFVFPDFKDIIFGSHAITPLHRGATSNFTLVTAKACR